MAAENPAPDKDNPGQKMFIIRIDETEYKWPEEKISWFGSAPAIRMFLPTCGGSLPQCTWPTEQICPPRTSSKRISDANGSVGRGTSTTDSGSLESTDLRVSSL